MSAPSPALLGVRFVVGLGVLAVAPQVLWDALQRAGVLAAPRDRVEHVEASMLVFALAAALVVVFARWQRPGLPWRPARAPRVLASYAPFAPLWVGVLIAWLAAARALGHPVPPQDQLVYLATAADPARPGFWMVVVGAVVAAPLAEEILFRGYLQQALAATLRPVWAIAIAAAVFGAVHTLPYALPVGLLGAFFGALAWRCGSLWPAVLAHALHNATTVAVTVLWPDSLTLLYPR